MKEGKENGTYRRGNDFDWPRGRGQEDRKTRTFEQARDTEKAPGPVTRRSCWGCGLTGSGPSGAGAGTTGQQSATRMPDTKTRDNRTAGMRGRRAVRGSERLRRVEDQKDTEVTKHDNDKGGAREGTPSRELNSSSNEK